MGQMEMKYIFDIGKIFLYPWAKVSQVSDVAHGPLVSDLHSQLFKYFFFGLKVDQFKFGTFADIPAYFIVIKIHVRMKRTFFFGLKS
jgi:hypothetical protein